MQKQIKTTVAIILTACLLLSLWIVVPTFSASASGSQIMGTSGDWEYDIDENFQCAITKYNGSDADVEVPSEFRGYNVVGIRQNAFRENRYIINVNIPDTITYIANAAFYNCSMLESVRFSTNLESIGEEAFRGCSNLKSITLPSSVTRLYRGVFRACESLKSADLSACKIESLPQDCFLSCEDLEDIRLPEIITSIGGWAFCGCSSLRNIQLPSRLTELYRGAFNGCSSLESIYLPKYLEKVEWWKFYDNIYDRYNDAIFDGCYSLKGIDVSPENRFFESIDGVVYNEDITRIIYLLRNKESVRIPNSFTSIGKKDDIHSVDENATPKTFIIPPTVTSIDTIGYYYAHYSYNNKIDGFTIMGVKGSEAERYAINNDFEFVEVDPSVFDENPTEPSEEYTTVPDETEPTEAATDSPIETEPAATQPETQALTQPTTQSQTQPVTEPPTQAPTQRPIIKGDLNDDGKVDSKDRITLTRHLAHWISYENINEQAADVTADGRVDSKDRVYLTRYLAKWQGYGTL